MREIKFRAWDGKQTLFDFDAIAWSSLMGELPGKTPKLVDFGWEVDKYTEAELMQYTGLKDKNGVEIYEGDICRIDHKDKRYSITNGAVEWDNKNACWSFDVGTPSEVSWSHEVIGNIYENPELLEQPNDK